MTDSLAGLWGEYQEITRFWDSVENGVPDGACDRATLRQTAIAEQMAATEARDLGEVAMQAKVLADMMSVDPVDPERSLAVSIAKRLEALAGRVVA